MKVSRFLANQEIVKRFWANTQIALFFVLITSTALGQSLTPILYQARILKPDGNPVEGNVTVQFSIRSTDGCVLWAENKTVNVKKGAISEEVGAGTNIAAGGANFSSIFLNTGTLSGLSGCSSGSTYAPGVNDERVLHVSFNDGSGVQTLPALPVRSVPFSHYSRVARSVLQIIGVDLDTTAPNNGEVLQYNSGTNKWEANAVGTGSVTNVGLTGNAMFNITNSPITTAGTFNVDFNSQTQNFVLAAPNGSNGIPTFRAMVAADIPNLPASKITSGTLAAAVGGTGLVPSGAGDANKVIGINAAGTNTELKSIAGGTNVTIDTSVPGTITINSTSGGTIAASQITSGTLAQAVLGTYLGNIHPSQMTGGTLSQAVLGTYLGPFNGLFGGTISAAQVTLGTMNHAQLGNIDASMTTTGTFALARLGILPFTQLAGTISTAQLGTIDGSSLTNIAAGSITTGTMNQAQLGTYLGSVAASQVSTGTLNQAQLGTYLGNLNGSQITAGTIDTARLGSIPFTSLNGTISQAQLGLIDGSAITSVAASSITSGTFNQSVMGTYLGNVHASQVTGGTLSQSVLGTYLGPFSGLFGGTISAAQVTLGTMNQAQLGTYLGILDASQITSGTLSQAALGTYLGSFGGAFTGTIGAHQITGGTIDTARLGTFDASLTTTGTFAQAQLGTYLGNLNGSQITAGTIETARLGSIPFTSLNGTISQAQLGQIDGSAITSVAASSITSGTFNQSVMGTYLGSIQASQVNSGTLAQAQLGTYLGYLSAAQTTTGTFDLARLGVLPFTQLSGTISVAQAGTYLGTLDASQITTGTLSQAVLGTYLGSFGGAFSGTIGAHQITGGTLNQAQLGTYLGILDASQTTTGTFAQARLGTYLGTLDGSQITTGTLDTARLGSIPFTSLNGTISQAQLGQIDGSAITSVAASSITTGTFNQSVMGTYLGTIGAAQVIGGTLSQAVLGTYLGPFNGYFGGTIAASQVTLGTMNQAQLGTYLGNIDGSQITSGTLSQAALGTYLGAFGGAFTGTIGAHQITGGTMNHAQLGNILAAQVVGGTLSQAVLGTYLGPFNGQFGGTISAAQVTLGTMNQAQLGDFDADKTVSGTFAIARLGSIPFTSLNGTISQAQLGQIDGSAITSIAASSITTGTFNQSVMGTYLGTIGAAQVIGGTLSQAVLGTYLGPFNGLFGGTISAAQVTLGTMNQAQLGTYLGNIDGSQITSGTLSQAALGTYLGAFGGAFTGTIGAHQITGGTMNHAQLGNILAAQVVGGTLSQAVLGTYLGPFNGLFGGTISAAQITLGTMNQAQLGVFDADKTVSGTFAIARLGSIPFTSLSGTISQAQLGQIDGSAITSVAASSITTGTFNQSVMGTYLGTIGAAQVIGGTLSQAVLGTYLGPFNGYFGGTIAASQVTLGTMNQAQLGTYLGNIDGSQITSGTLSQAALGTYLGAFGGAFTGTIGAHQITGGTMNHAQLGNILAAQVVGGTLSQAVLGTYLGPFNGLFGGTISAAQITLGTMNQAQLGNYLGVLDASQTTTGTFSQAVLGTYLGTIGAAQVIGGTLSQSVLGTYLGPFGGSFTGTIAASQVTAGTLDTARLGTIPNSITTGTSANTANTLVLRDGTGGFEAGTVGIATHIYRGAGQAQVNAPTAGNYTLTLPTTPGTAGQVLTTSGTTGLLSWSNGSTSFPLLANPQGSAGAPAYSFSTTTNTGMYSTGVGTLAFATAGTNAITVSNLGFTGLGTNTPSTRLHVNGEATIEHASNGGVLTFKRNDSDVQDQENLAVLRVDSADSSSGPMDFIRVQAGGAHTSGDTSTYMTFYTTPGASSSPQMRISIDSPGGVGIGNHALISQFAVEAQSNYDLAAYILNPNDNDGEHGLRVNNRRTNATANALDVQTNSVTKFLVRGDGLVGVGTNAPTAQLHVQGDLKFAGAGSVGIYPPVAGNYSLTWPSHPGTNGQVLSSTGTSGVLAWVSGVAPTFPLQANPQGSAATPAYSFSNTTNTGMYSTGVGTLAFATAGTEAVTVTNLGRVGIGTATPGSVLDVTAASSNLLSIYSTGTNSAFLSIDNRAGGQNSSIILRDAQSPIWDIGKASDNTFFIWDNARTRNLLQTSTTGNLILQPVVGSVGIGTLSPTAILEVRGDLKLAGAGSIGIYPPIAGNYTLTYPSTPGSAGQALLTSGTGGILSWGTPVATPSFPLLANPQGTAGAPAYSFSTTTNTGMYSPGVGTLAFATAGTNHLSIDNQGFVGIGTTGTARLAIHGRNTSAALSVTGPFPINSSTALVQIGDAPGAGSNGTVLSVNTPSGFSGDALWIGQQGYGLMSVLPWGSQRIRMKVGYGANSVGVLNVAGEGTVFAPNVQNIASFADYWNERGIVLGADSTGNGTVGVILSHGTSNTSLAFWTYNPAGSVGERMRITANGSVGIGTTAPTALLHVAGNMKLSSTTGSVALYSAASGNYSLTFPVHPGGSGQVLSSTGTSGILSWVSGVAPSFPLQANPQGSAATPAYSFSNTTNTGMYSTGVGTLAFSTAGTNAVTINNLGYVGIGTLNASAKLDIMNGDIRLSNQRGILWGAAGSVKQDQYYNMVMSSDLGVVIAANADNAGGEGLYLSAGGTGPIEFQTSSAGASRMTITDTGLVGIGAQNPSKLLTVGSTNVAGISSGVAGAQLLVVGDSGGAGDGQAAIRLAHSSSNDSWSRAYEFRTGYSGNNNLDAFGLYDVTSGAYRMTITDSGSVGFGTTNPLAKVEVVGDLRIRSTGGSVAFNAPSSGNYSLTFPAHPGGSGQVLTTSGTSGVLSWTTASGSASFPLLSTTLGSAGTPVYTFNASSNTGLFAPGVGTLGFSTAGTERVRMTSSGSVGIGTTSPGSPLDVRANSLNNNVINVQNTNAAGTSGFQTMDSGGTVQAGFGWGNASNPLFPNSLVVSTGGSYPIVFATQSTERMRVSSSGSVGIGTTNPGEMLDVAGKVRATNFVVSSDGRFKRDIATVDNALAQLTKLRGVTYHWRQNEFPERNFTGEKQYGVIAQEVQTVYPDLVYSDLGGNLSVNYQGLIAPLIESVKELNAKCEMSEEQSKTLAAAVQENSRDIASLKKENEELKKKLEAQQGQINWLIEQVQKK